LAVFFDFPLFLGFLPGLLTLIGLLWLKGVSPGLIWRMSINGAIKTKEVCGLLMFIALMLPAWQLSGTVSQLVQLAVGWIRLEHFLLIVFGFTFLISMLLGTAIGSLSIMGVPVMSMAHLAGIPLDWAAGALISGAFVGDRTSPVSSSFHLLRTTLRVETEAQFRAMLPSTLIAILCSGFFYFCLDYGHIQQWKDPAAAVSYSVHSLIVLIPPALMLLVIGVVRNLRLAFLCSIGAASVIFFADGGNMERLLESMWTGANHMGGVKGMLEVVLFIAMAGAYSEMMEECRILEPFLRPFLANETSRRANVFQSLYLSVLICLISPNQAFPIMLTGRVLYPHWQRHFTVFDLLKIMGNSTMVLVGILPWNLLAILCKTLVHVPVLSYAPFSVFLWILPCITLLGAVLDQPPGKGWKKEKGKILI
jgi:NhaC family Na+:H+ antiporter